MSDVHVLPINDLIEHSETRGCVCRPDVQDLGGGIVVVHHAADAREYFEPDGPVTTEAVQ
jgi:hypothetical protein